MGIRKYKISSRIQRILCEALLKKCRDADLRGCCISAVEVNKSLSLAKVFVAIGSSDEDSTMHKLVKNRPFLRSQLAKGLNMKYVPDIAFFVDHAQENLARLESLLAKERKNQNEEDCEPTSRSLKDHALPLYDTCRTLRLPIKT